MIRRCLRSIILIGLVVPPLGCPLGCGASRPSDASPIVAPDSDAGRRATAESAELLRLRQRQEAAARQRRPALPTEG